MKAVFSCLFTALLPLSSAGNDGAPGPYRPDWQSLTKHEHPQWLLDAKFGIYGHWGVYSVAAYKSEWYGKMMYDPDDRRGAYEYHRRTFGPQNQFGYKDLIPRFRAEKFDPNEWAELIRQSGARYAGIAVVHHDGFGLWDSDVYRWNAGKMGPKRDLYGDLAKALRARNLKIIATEHHMRTFDWYLPKAEEQKRQKAAGVDLYDPKYADFYWNHHTSLKADFIRQWKRKLTEVIDKYHPDVLWFDGGDFTSPGVAAPVLSSLAYYYNQAAARKNPVDVLNKFAGTMKFNFPEEFGILTYEAGRDRPDFVAKPWIDDLSIAEVGWGYTHDLEIRKPREIILGLVDRVGRGGGLLLSLAPMSNGLIPDNQKFVLREIGDWLKVNGEAIYGTRPWKIQTEGSAEKLVYQRNKHKAWRFDAANAEDIRFTRKGNHLFAVALGWPEDGKLRIKTLREGMRLGSGGISKVSLLGSKAPVRWKRTADALEVELPAEKPCKYAYALKIAAHGRLE
ncbi:MAG: alpha-L-fucosidase [Acidobacteria bacterium]|nr:alpha-L-fucosidase [Acidobacteriota bacterium]